MIAVNVITDILPGFAVVVAIPVVLWWYVRRSQKGRPNRLRITDKTALGKSTWIAVVEVADQRFLVGAGESGVGLISELPALPEVVADPATDPADSPMNGMTEQPRIGLIRRLQLMTVRGPAQSPWRSFGAGRK
ncbi:MAG: flagellar biosynthetic protein FliO [Acidimicrobiia bacterium]